MARVIGTMVAIGFVSVAGLYLAGRWSDEPSTDPPAVFLQENGRIDCGAASLYIVCKLSGDARSLQDLRDLTKTCPTGTNMLNLKNAAIRCGFEVDACKCGFETLHRHVNKPGCYAIIHSSKSHFIPIIGSQFKGSVLVAEPAIGFKNWTETELREVLEWDGAVLLLTKT